MPVYHDRPLPDDHPFKGGRIIFGAKPPGSSAKPSTQEEETSSTKSSPEEEDNSFDITAHRSLEASLQRRFNPNMETLWMELSPSLGADTTLDHEATL